jgi:tRNA modification GTPase
LSDTTTVVDAVQALQSCQKSRFKDAFQQISTGGDMLNSAFVSLEDTIVAISTAPGLGAIAVVRVSGPKARPIVERIFVASRVPSRGKEGHPWLQDHRATHGHIKDYRTGERLDEVVVTPFLGPNSYTGEDLIEISCHGSPIVTRTVLGLCLDLGGRLAQQGEFTKRAFLSGRIDLTQAEAVLDLIQAKTSFQSKLALSALSGEIGRQIKRIRSDLMQLLTTVLAGIDFPEEIGDTPEQDIKQVVLQSISSLQKLAETARSGRFLRDGLKLAIVGRPNAGKSSLLNQMLRFERAIVTDVAGTTRDLLEEPLDINGIPVVLVDTAGIRHTKDSVELIGIERARTAIGDAHLVLLVMDLTQGFGAEEEKIVGWLGEKPWILLKNKVDLASEKQLSLRKEVAQDPRQVAQLLISAKTGSGLDLLFQTVERFALGGGTAAEGGASLNDRQAALCEKAVAGLNLVVKTVENGLPQDCLASDLKISIDCLSEICGELVSEEVISEVFANFCIGK